MIVVCFHLCKAGIITLTSLRGRGVAFQVHSGEAVTLHRVGSAEEVHMALGEQSGTQGLSFILQGEKAHVV